MTEITKEIRVANSFEIRQIGEGEEKQTHIQGYALTFDSISEDLGFREVISKGALDECDLSDVVLNFNHDNDKILARNSKNEGIGSLVLTIDEKGLFFDAVPTDTTYARDLIENMESGIIGKCSFSFRLDYMNSDAQTWYWAESEEDFDMRTIHKIAELYDVSVVTRPAYESTSSTVYKRSKDKHENAKQEEMLRRKLALELELI